MINALALKVPSQKYIPFIPTESPQLTKKFAQNGLHKLKNERESLVSLSFKLNIVTYQPVMQF